MNLHIKISPSPWKKVSLPGSTAEFRDMITVLKIRLHIKIKSTQTRGITLQHSYLHTECVLSLNADFFRFLFAVHDEGPTTRGR